MPGAGRARRPRVRTRSRSSPRETDGVLEVESSTQGWQNPLCGVIRGSNRAALAGTSVTAVRSCRLCPCRRGHPAGLGLGVENLSTPRDFSALPSLTGHLGQVWTLAPKDFLLDTSANFQLAAEVSAVPSSARLHGLSRTAY